MKSLAMGMMSLMALAGVAGEFDGYRKHVVEESVELAAFENPAFDDVSKYGSAGVGAEIGAGYGFNGNGGLRIRPPRRAFSHGFKLKARLEKGRRYVFSADVRGHGRASGSVAMDAYFVNPRKYASGCGAWGASSSPLADGWSHQYVEVVARHDADEMDYRFMIHCNMKGDAPAGDEDYVDVDNVQLSLTAPKWYFCNTWPTHNLLHADEGRIRCHSAFWGDFFGPEARPAYACELRAADGHRLASAVCEADSDGNFTVSFGPQDYRGAAKLRVTLYDRQARLERGTREIDLTVAVPERTKRLFVREDGVVLKDGRPFMPLGFYTDLCDARKYDAAAVEFHLRRLRDAGFDTIMDYQSYSLAGKRRDEFYALCEKYGIHVLCDDFKATDFPSFVRQMPGFRKRARELVQYPALIGFYTMDEAPESATAPLSALRRMLNEVAPGRVVNTCNIMRAAPYLPTADIQGGDCYPISKNAGACLMRTHDRVAEAKACAPAAIWYAPQCFNWARSAPNRSDPEAYRKSGREPTTEEMLAVALCMIQDGTTGFLFYAYFDLVECPVPEWREARWAGMVEIAKELRALEPFIMSGCPQTELPHADRADATRVTVLTDGKGAKRVIVCGFGQKHETTFSLPADCGALRSRRGNVTSANGTYTFKGKDFSCDILE